MADGHSPSEPLAHLADVGLGIPALSLFEGSGLRGVAVDTRTEAGRSFVSGVMDGLCRGSTPLPKPLPMAEELGFPPGKFVSSRELADARLAAALAKIDGRA